MGDGWLRPIPYWAPLGIIQGGGGQRGLLEAHRSGLKAAQVTIITFPPAEQGHDELASSLPPNSYVEALTLEPQKVQEIGPLMK